MTTGTGASAAAADAEGFASDWKELRADGDIQFAPVEMPEAAEPPGWWRAFGEWLGEALRPLSDALASLGRVIGLSGQALMWTMIVLASLVALYVLWRNFALPHWRRGTKPDETPQQWAPDAGEALALLEDADRLAAEGRYDAATHLLLQRSVGQIAAARPDWLEPSSTAREIAALPGLPQAARGAFGVIAERVERSLFALRRLSAEDWQAARAAYAQFALAAPRPAAAVA